MTPKRLGDECSAFVEIVTVTEDWLGQEYPKVFEAYINSPMNAGRAKRVEQQDRRCPVYESINDLGICASSVVVSTFLVNICFDPPIPRMRHKSLIN